MGTVTGYTAEHMKAIEDEVIVSAAVVGNNLILTRHDGTTINAGNVQGPAGPQGVGASDMSAVYQLLSPVGGMQPYGGAAAPTGWLLCDGASLLRASYAALFTAIGSAYGAVDGTHFNVPDLRQRFPMGKAPGGTGSVLNSPGGSMNAIVVSHSHSHTHSISTTSAGTHSHSVAGDSGERIWVTAGSQNNNVPGVTPGSGNSVPSHIDAGGAHTHPASASTDATASGVSGTDANLPPYIVVNYIIRY